MLNRTVDDVDGNWGQAGADAALAGLVSSGLTPSEALEVGMRNNYAKKGELMVFDNPKHARYQALGKKAFGRGGAMQRNAMVQGALYNSADDTKKALHKFKKDLDELWLVLDTDGNEQASRAEVKAALERKGTKQDRRLARLLGREGEFHIFDKYDVNKDEQISKAEFYAEFFLETRILDLFRIADTDRSGALDRAEFEQMLLDFPEIEVLVASKGVEPRFIFDQIDENKDGSITAYEFMKLLSINNDLTKIFRMVDKEAKGVVSKDQLNAELTNNPDFETFFKTHGPKRGIQCQEFIFEQLDANKDGYLTLDEFVKRFGTRKSA